MGSSYITCNVFCQASKKEEDSNIDTCHILKYDVKDVNPMYLERYQDPSINTRKLKDDYDMFFRVCSQPLTQIHIKDFEQML